jgi:hypothetical protein
MAFLLLLLAGTFLHLPLLPVSLLALLLPNNCHTSDSPWRQHC